MTANLHRQQGIWQQQFPAQLIEDGARGSADNRAVSLTEQRAASAAIAAGAVYKTRQFA